MKARALILCGVALFSLGCQSRADALYDHTKRLYERPPPVRAPLTPLPSDEHRARLERLFLVLWLSGLCGGCTFVPGPVAPASCLQQTCLAEVADGR